jgi:hypothetical protein
VTKKDVNPSCTFEASVVVSLFSIPICVSLNSPSMNGPVVKSSVFNDSWDYGLRSRSIIDSIGVFQDIDFVGGVNAILELLGKRLLKVNKKWE